MDGKKGTEWAVTLISRLREASVLVSISTFNAFAPGCCWLWVCDPVVVTDQDG